MKIFIFVFFLFFCFFSPLYALDVSLLVNTSSGPVLGFPLLVLPSPSSPNASAFISAWRGIPYASPPLGNLRWSPPVPPPSWSAPLPALSFSPPCMQPDGSGSEDCLFLNVYRSPPLSSDSFSRNALLPILFYIHGGGLNGGSGADDDWSKFLAKAPGGLLVVQCNYRLNLFGFLAISALSQEQGGVSGNYGIMDQQLALRWVQQNARAFGGDPARVTVAGQSSGGTSLFALMSSPASRGLFSAGISMSGSTNLSMGLARAEQQNLPIVVKSGCLRAQSAETVACLRGLSPDKIVPGLFPDAWNMPGIWGLPHNPAGMDYAGIVVVDGKTITMSFQEALAVGLVDVPLLFGNMGQECDQAPDQDVCFEIFPN